MYLISIISQFLLSLLVAQTEFSPEEIYEKVNDAVVIVLTYDSNGELVNQGSGIVVSEDSYILTNYHLMEGSMSVKVLHVNLLIDDVEITGGNEEVDLLVLRIPASNLSAIKITESKDIKIGERIYAIGSPMGYENSISE